MKTLFELFVLLYRHPKRHPRPPGFAVFIFHVGDLKQAANLKKVYPADTSFTRFSGNTFSEDPGRLLETIVCNQLARTGKNLFYWKDERNREVDFVVCEGLIPLSIIQVSENTDDERVWKRESESLLNAGEAMGVKDLIILVNSISRRPLVESITVKSILDWLLVQ